MFDVVGDVESAIEKLLATEGHIGVVRLTKALTRLECAWIRAVGEYDRSDDWRAEGFVNAAAALRAKTGVPHGVARAALEMGRKLARLPLVSDAFASGDISRRHAEIVTKAYTPERASALSELEPVLVDAARAATPRQFARIIARVSDAIDGDDGAGSAWARFERRRLHVSKTLDGMVVGDFVLDPEDGDVFLRALHHMQRRDSPRGDTRLPEQKRADAFVDLIRTGATRARRGPARSVREFVHVIDVADIERRGGRMLADEVRRNAPELPKATRRRLTCDAGFARVITDGPSQVIDVGRSTRNVPSALWRALVVRDGACTFEGCDRGPEWCDAHHVVHWEDGGVTALGNLRLLCRRHHRMVHEGHCHDPPSVGDR